MKSKRIAIVGAGFYGLVFAEQLSKLRNVELEIFEKRNHVGGNAWSYLDKSTGIEVHKYGSHLFHTSNTQVWNYINQFTSFSEYRHSVWANHRGSIYSMPINLGTISQFLGKHLSPKEAELWVNENRFSGVQSAENLEQKAISLIGKPLYEAFVKGYTQKQWQTDPTKLPPDIISRLPVRFNFNNRYFNDTYEGLPLQGYFGLFQNLVSAIDAKIHIETDFLDYASHSEFDLVVYSGPIDRFFNYSHGVLGWRTLDFEFEIHEVTDFQGASVINYADTEVPYTRIHEFKHLHPERKYGDGKTIIAKEFSRFADSKDEPYYPINSIQDREMLLKYRKMCDLFPNVIFGGRLGSYRYLDMHMAIASALSDYRNIALDKLQIEKG